MYCCTGGNPTLFIRVQNCPVKLLFSFGSMELKWSNFQNVNTYLNWLLFIIWSHWSLFYWNLANSFVHVSSQIIVMLKLSVTTCYDISYSLDIHSHIQKILDFTENCRSTRRISAAPLWPESMTSIHTGSLANFLSGRFIIRIEELCGQSSICWVLITLTQPSKLSLHPQLYGWPYGPARLHWEWFWCVQQALGVCLYGQALFFWGSFYPKCIQMLVC